MRVYPPVRISGSGLVTSVGLSTAATAAAIRAGLSNAEMTRFIDWGGEPMLAHVVPIEAPNPREKLLRMVATAIEECLHSVDPGLQPALLLCLAEPARSGIGDGRSKITIREIEVSVQARFSSHSFTIAAGRVGGLLALQHARVLLHEGQADAVLVAGVDSYVNWPTLSRFEDQHRLLTSRNSNGFLPGEGAAAVMVTRAEGGTALYCEGIGAASEPAIIESDLPLRAEGLVQAIRAAAHDARRAPHDFELQIAAISGEHYYFKEAALAATRLLRAPVDESDFWHPADCVGEVGAAAAPLAIAVAATACTKGYASASRILIHVAGDGDERAAAFFRFGALR